MSGTVDYFRTGVKVALTLLVKSQICRKWLGHAIFEIQKDRGHATVKSTLVALEIPLLRLNQQSLLWPCLRQAQEKGGQDPGRQRALGLG